MLLCFEPSGLGVICMPGKGLLGWPPELGLLLSVKGQELKGLLLLLLLKGQAFKGSKGALDPLVLPLVLLGGFGRLVEVVEALLAAEEADGVGDWAGMVGGGWGGLAFGF